MAGQLDIEPVKFAKETISEVQRVVPVQVKDISLVPPPDAAASTNPLGRAVGIPWCAAGLKLPGYGVPGCMRAVRGCTPSGRSTLF
jgi:hypothetical protein